jgi:hypothetical protein
MGVFKTELMHLLPSNTHLLNAIWSYRHKRSPIGEILKHKARLCVDGSQQEHGRDYWEKYAPVTSWSTVHLLLLLSNIMNLRSCQVDYTQAFPQAPLSDLVFMKIPQGWYVDNDGIMKPHSDPKHHDRTHYIRLLRNLYGCKQAARNWFKYLTTGLLGYGFTHPRLTLVSSFGMMSSWSSTWMIA